MISTYDLTSIFKVKRRPLENTLMTAYIALVRFVCI